MPTAAGTRPSIDHGVGADTEWAYRQHRIDAASVICSEDSAWDTGRILDEERSLTNIDEHPVRRWLAGLTRYDVETTPAEYFKEGETPTRFHIRRLSAQTWGVLRDMSATMTQIGAAYKAFAEGVVRVEGLDADVVWPGSDLRRTLTDEDMREVERVLPRPYILEVGAAVLVANADLTRPKKNIRFLAWQVVPKPGDPYALYEPHDCFRDCWDDRRRRWSRKAREAAGASARTCRPSSSGQVRHFRWHFGRRPTPISTRRTGLCRS